MASRALQAKVSSLQGENKHARSMQTTRIWGNGSSPDGIAVKLHLASGLILAASIGNDGVDAPPLSLIDDILVVVQAANLQRAQCTEQCLSLVCRCLSQRL